MSEENDPMTKAVSGLAQTQVIAESVIGYHKKLIEGGIGAEAADEMAKAYHAELMKMLAASMAAGAAKAAGFIRRVR